MNAYAWLARLVAFDTTSRNSNLDLIADVAAWFEQHKVAVRITRAPNEPKANLLATLPASDGSIDGGIILSGHTDVVPVDGQAWDTDPFVAIKIGGGDGERIYGRGTCDMKGFLAVTLALVPEWCKQALPRPVHIAFSYDEEIGCRGVPLLIADLHQAGMKPAACIVGEPTNMRPVMAHKGIQVFRCRVQGKAAHSSLTPQACNAIEYAAQLIAHIRQIADDMRNQGPLDPCFDVPFSSMTTNKINGGIATNIVPDTCEFFFEFRHLPQVAPEHILEKITTYAYDALLPLMQKEYPQASITIENSGKVPAFEISKEAAIYRAACAWSAEEDTLKVSYATEAGLFQQATIESIICGPGSIEQAHRANEFVTCEQIEKCATFLRNIVGQAKK